MYNKILVLLDGSKLSECSLEHVRYIATGCHVAEVTLLSVVEAGMMIPPPFTEDWGSRKAAIEAGEKIRQTDKENRQKAQDYLNKIAADLGKEGINVKTAVLVPDIDKRTADAILDYAQENTIDLIIMSTHGRSGISRWAFGSVADKIVRHASVPTLIISPTGCRINYALSGMKIFILFSSPP
jgi:nucleotide-binding universal stress UspA family protein